MGVSLLMCLAGCSATSVTDVCVDALEDPGLAPRIAERSANWPDDLAREMVEIAAGLMWRRVASRRIPLQQVNLTTCPEILPMLLCAAAKHGATRFIATCSM